MTTEKLTMKSTDMADENFRKLQELFPEAVTEIEENGKIVRAIDKDKLQQLISTSVVEGSKERYQFTWPGKRDAILLANTPTNKTLRPVKGENKTDDACFNTTENLYIEGDNLEVLKLLQEKYLGKIKMIYIDPPYNTGNDFIYKDKFAQDAQEYIANSGQTDEEGNRLVKNVESNGRFHSDWLSMMYPRLKIARNLLADDGFIFISIDDNELVNLNKICDYIFGDANYRSTITVIANPGGRDYGGIAKTTEYILVYSKSESSVLNKIPDESHVFDMYDEIGPFELRELRNRNTVFNDKNRPNLCYPFFLNPNNVDKHGLFHISLEKDSEHYIEVMPLISNGIQTVWRWGKEEKSRKNLNINIKGKRKQDGTYMIVEKYRDENVMVKNIWQDTKFRTENGSIQIRDLFGEKGFFPYPKPFEIPSVLAMTCCDEDDIILDFFSGSATTAHAVMQLNAEDGGNKKFIMVQLPEVCDEKSEAYKAGYNTICDIGKERIRRAGAKIKEELEKTNPERAKTLDTGFRVLRLDSSNMKDVFYRPVDLKRDNLLDYASNVKEDRTEMDLLFQIMPELNADYTSKIEETYEDGKKIFNVESNYIVACFAENISEKVIRKVASYKPDYAVFRDSCFPKDSDLANVEQIFRAESPETRLRIL